MKFHYIDDRREAWFSYRKANPSNKTLSVPSFCAGYDAGAKSDYNPTKLKFMLGFSMILNVVLVIILFASNVA